MTTLAFDIYGTLIDTAGVTSKLTSMIDDDATVFSDLWRAKQLEYTWRYGLMGRYENFRVCTRQALDFSCLQTGHELNPQQREALMQKYLDLPVFGDVPEGLQQLNKAGVKMYGFSNGLPADLEILLENAGIRKILDGVVSVDDKQTFKPDPVLYHYFVEKTGAGYDDTWLVSSNGFDVCGAVAAGMHAVWLQRNVAVPFDPWDVAPEKTVSSFNELTKLFVNQ